MRCPPGSQLTGHYMALLLIFIFFFFFLSFLRPKWRTGVREFLPLRPRRGGGGGGVGATIISVCGFPHDVCSTAVFKLEALFCSRPHCPVILFFLFFFKARCRKCFSANKHFFFSDKPPVAQADFSSRCFSCLISFWHFYVDLFFHIRSRFQLNHCPGC